MSLQIKNNTPVLVRHPSSLIISEITGWGSAEGSVIDGADSADTRDWYNLGDDIDFRTIKQYIAENPNTVRMSIYFEYGTYIRYSGTNISTFCPDYIPRTLIDYIRFESISQSKSALESEVE